MIAQRHTLANALRVAADQYELDAGAFEQERTVQQFRDQALEARKLADEIEQALTIRLTD